MPKPILAAREGTITVVRDRQNNRRTFVTFQVTFENDTKQLLKFETNPKRDTVIQYGFVPAIDSSFTETSLNSEPNSWQMVLFSSWKADCDRVRGIDKIEYQFIQCGESYICELTEVSQKKLTDHENKMIELHAKKASDLSKPRLAALIGYPKTIDNGRGESRTFLILPELPG